MSKFEEIYSLNTDDFDAEYAAKTGVGVHASYGTSGNDGEVVYELTALANDGERDAGWTEEDFVRYWNERGTMWQDDVRSSGDAGVGGIVRAWMGKRWLATACYIVLKAA